MTHPFRALVVALMIASTGSAAADEIAAADLIDRVGRVLRVTPATAATWYAGVVNLDAWPAQLERALLETLGPVELRQPEPGLQSLKQLLHQSPPDVHVREAARETLAVIVELIKREHAAAQQRDQARQELREERAAHQQTLEKLNALRQIDHQIDERNGNGGR